MKAISILVINEGATMGFFSNLFGVSNWSKEKLRSELHKYSSLSSQNWGDDWKNPAKIKEAQAKRQSLRDKADEIRAELKRRGLEETESFAELMQRTKR